MTGGIGAAVGLGAGGGEYGAGGGALGGAALSVATRKFGPRMFMKVAEKFSPTSIQKGMTSPKWGRVLKQAVEQGGVRSAAARHYTLMQTDPDYREHINSQETKE